MIINFGSINIDHVYRVPHMPRAGETLAVSSYQKFLGGKGANQSIAITRAGGDVRHIGAVGPDGDWVIQAMRDAGVDPGRLLPVMEATGHAIVVVDDTGENQILICSGANICLSEDQIVSELNAQDGEGNWVLMQNETNLIPEIAEQAKMLGYKVAYSAAPFVAEATLPLLDRVDLIAVNEIEAQSLAGAYGCSVEDLPCAALLVTRGGKGASLYAEQVQHQTAFDVEAVDTTGAGDTFLGSFLARYCGGDGIDAALRYAAAASAIQITRLGAADAIPQQAEVAEFLNTHGACQ